jgi:hypothetical protein
VVVSEERFGFEAETRWSDLAAISIRGVRLTERDLDTVGKALAVGGRFLWLGGEDRLRGAKKGFEARGFSAEGPNALLAGSEARLLVVSRTR